MLWRLLKKQRAEQRRLPDSRRGDLRLQIILWTLWTLAVIATGYINWHADVVAQHPVDLLGLAIHSALVGIIGLVVMTIIEMRLEPWRFLDDEPT